MQKRTDRLVKREEDEKEEADIKKEMEPENEKIKQTAVNVKY